LMIVAEEPNQKRRQHVLQLFRDVMKEAWYENGYKIVYGSEEFDRLVHPIYNSTLLMETLLDILPWSAPSGGDGANTNTTIHTTATTTTTNATQMPTFKLTDMEAVVVYRSPRIYHARSVWHEAGKINQTFSEFLSRGLQPHMHVLGALPLAHAFVERGIRTTVLDMTGLPPDTNLCHAVICDVLRDVECNNKTQVVGLVNDTTQEIADGISTLVFNQRSDNGPMDLTTQQWDRIEQVMQDFDCGWKESLTGNFSSLFRTLYPRHVFADCQPNVQYPLRSLSWMIAQVRTIAGENAKNSHTKENIHTIHQIEQDIIKETNSRLKNGTRNE